MRYVLRQGAPRLPLERTPFADDRTPDGVPWLDVLGCAPGPWDLVDAPAWPRVPGAVVALRAPDGRALLCAGFVPCGACEPCRVGLHLACASPLRPGWSRDGGLATAIRLPEAFLAPIHALPAEIERLAHALALLAAAGPTYQALAFAGAAPGDTVLLHGRLGPGALPLRLIVALGLRVVWVPAEHGPRAALDPGLDAVEVSERWPRLQDLPTPRLHIVDLGADEASVAGWLPLVPGAVACTLVGPPPLTAGPPLERLLAGQAALRWVRDLHPHLALDVAALALHARVELRPHVALLDDGFEQAFDELSTGKATRWPVFVPHLSDGNGHASPPGSARR